MEKINNEVRNACAVKVKVKKYLENDSLREDKAHNHSGNLFL